MGFESKKFVCAYLILIYSSHSDYDNISKYNDLFLMNL